MPTPRPAPLRALALLGVLLAATPAPAQPGVTPPPSPDTTKRTDQLINEVASLQSEVARLRKRIAELENENRLLRANGGKLPNDSDPKSGGGSGGGGGSDAAGDFAAVPDQPLAAPDAALAWFRKDYADKLKDAPALTPASTPAEKQKAQADAGAWARAAKRHRGRVEWIIEVKGFEPDALKGGGDLRFIVVDSVSRKPYSDLVLTQPLNPAQSRAVSDKPDQKTWKLVGVYNAEARFNKDLSDKDASPVFIGPFAEMNTTLTVQTLTPAG